KVARLIGRVAWSLEIQGPRVEPRYDRRGPDAIDLRLLWRSAVAAGDSARARRDRCVVAMLYDLGLRRGELVGSELADLEPGPAGPAAVWIRGKGRSEKERLTVPPPTARALQEWIAARGDHPGPLVHRLDGVRPEEHRRLSGESIRRIVRRLGEAAGITRP